MNANHDALAQTPTSHDPFPRTDNPAAQSAHACCGVQP